MVDIIKKHGGTIDKFIGDAIMAEFGTPVSYEDNCKRAVSAAYEMRDALSSVELGDLVMPEGMTFNIGIGIHYGDVIVGSIGSKDKVDYSVIGDNVNLASRLEGLTKTYGVQIVVSDSVRKDAGEDSFFFRHLDDVRVKGKKKGSTNLCCRPKRRGILAGIQGCLHKGHGLVQKRHLEPFMRLL
jgi:class 3 adenylate cyclase